MDNIRIKPVWTKSKDEIWDDVFAHRVQQENEKTSNIRRTDEKTENILRADEKVGYGFWRRMPKWSYAAAAAVLFVPLLLTGYFYTVTEETARGEHATTLLPDRSTVTLNAESSLTYRPFVWFVSRKVKLAGEACFEVKSGSRFSVLSGSKSVQVLGTTFNVYARADAYRVACLTGRVEVCNGQESAVLNPNMQAVLREQKFSIDKVISPATITGWMQGKFVFAGTPLREVIAEVERQYNVNIVVPDYDSNHLYTGNFSKNERPEEVLEIIGKAYGLTFSVE